MTEYEIPAVDDPEFREKALRTALTMLVDLCEHTAHIRKTFRVEVVPYQRGRYSIVVTDLRDGAQDLVCRRFGHRRATREAGRVAFWRGMDVGVPNPFIPGELAVSGA